MYIKRNLESIILKYLNTREILAIVGPRQGGKTTLLKKIQSELKDSVFLTFEDREDLELFETDIKGFAQKYFSSRFIFIDEFQYSKNGGKRLKYLFDTFPKSKIIISGSLSVDLTVHAIKFLVGRIFIFHLFHLDFEEYLSYADPDLYKVFKDIVLNVDLKTAQIGNFKISNVLNDQFYGILNKYIIWGGYPRVVLSSSEEEKKMVLKNIYNTYFLREIRDILGLIDDYKLSNLIKILSVQIGQLISYNDLSNNTGYDFIGLKKSINFLEKTFICRLISPFFVNRKKEITKNPKIYFLDTGLRNYIINDFNLLDNRLDKGFLYENFVFCQLMKKDLPINYWRTKSKIEIDFVTEVNNKKIPIESKSGIIKPVSIRVLKNFIKEYKSWFGVVLSLQGYSHEVKNKAEIYNLPHWII